MNAAAKRTDKPIVVKKYANRRLYDTGRSSYVTLGDLCEMVKKNQEFVVVDAKTGEDLTRSVLTQIIVEEESKEGNNLLPTDFLRKLIAFYGDKFQGLVPNYLEQAMDSFIKNQEQLRDQLGKSISSVGGMFPGLQAFEDMNKKNLAMFQDAMRAMTSFSLRGTANGAAPARPAPTGKPTTGLSRQERLMQIRKSIAELQRELQQLQN